MPRLQCTGLVHGAPADDGTVRCSSARAGRQSNADTAGRRSPGFVPVAAPVAIRSTTRRGTRRANGDDPSGGSYEHERAVSERDLVHRHRVGESPGQQPGSRCSRVRDEVNRCEEPRPVLRPAVGENSPHSTAVRRPLSDARDETRNEERNDRPGVEGEQDRRGGDDERAEAEPYGAGGSESPGEHAADRAEDHDRCEHHSDDERAGRTEVVDRQYRREGLIEAAERPGGDERCSCRDRRRPSPCGTCIRGRRDLIAPG